MDMKQEEHIVSTKMRSQMIDITDMINDALRASGMSRGLLTILVPHTTSAITINENADPDVERDILSFLERTVPRNGRWAHSEGNSDAHIKTSFFGSTLSLAFADGSLGLGTWQGIFFCEFDGPRTRKVRMSFLGID